MPLPSSSLRGERNLSNITPTSADSSTPLNSGIIQESLSSIGPSGIRLQCKENSASLIVPNLTNSERPSSPLLGLVPIPPWQEVLLQEPGPADEKMLELGMTPVTNGIREPAQRLRPTADTPTAVTERDAGVCIKGLTAPVRDPQRLNESIARGQWFHRKGVWSSSLIACSPTSAN